ncbi:MAG: hypothetical protein JNJ45_05475 [Chthonomonas sp.]|nr:hypothetical protein [Chthonomonas sp.]
MIGRIVRVLDMRYRVLESDGRDFYGFPIGVEDPVAQWIPVSWIDREDIPPVADVLQEVS